MVKYSAGVQRKFAALGEPHRVRILEHLSMREASMSDLAGPLGLSLPALTKHLRVLDSAGFIRTRKDGRLRICSLSPDAFADLEDWLAERREQWTQKLDSLERHLERRRKK